MGYSGGLRRLYGRDTTDDNAVSGNHNEQHYDHQKPGIHPMRLKTRHNTLGFTLIEIIITLTVTAVLATMIYTYFGKAFSESVTPITRLRNSASLQRVKENIRAD